MTSARYIAITAFIFFILCQLSLTALGQLGVNFDVKKPKEFENRVLRSEKSNQKKLKGTNRFIQNTITHYNYFFDANNKLKDILARAKASFIDDYSTLIPFYNYSLDVTAADSIQLDSIRYKAQTGIILHDLRSDWADNMYLLWGASYYLAKQFDSAHLMFQFINYAFAEKEKDGYYKMIGSARDGNSAVSISTKEKNSLTRRAFSEPPSRNDAFIWQVRNYLAEEQYSQAAILIQALKIDPVFPDRLKNDLEEVQAFYFYKQSIWDSAAFHLENALSNAVTNKEKARWQYLLGQLYEITGQYDKAETWYGKSINLTTDPIMEIYARLASVRVNKDSTQNYIAKNIDILLKMGKRDKYQDYRDIIYFMAAQMELERNNLDGALALLAKSTSYTSNDPAQRNKAFLQLAELSFKKRLYWQSYNYYDSLNLQDPSIKDPQAISARKLILARLAVSQEIINRQDSLQALAALPEEERKDRVKKMVHDIRKKEGLKDEGSFTTGGTTLPGTTQVPTTLFAETDKKAEWYFYNKNLRQIGSADFKSKWGSRPNKDNWRRSAVLANTITTRPGNDGPVDLQLTGDNKTKKETAITFDGLYANLPLSPEQMKASNDSTRDALFTQGVLFIQELEDCPSGTEALEKLRARFSEFMKMDQVLFNLYYCYNRNGETAKAAQIKQLLNRKFPMSRSTTIVNTGKEPGANGQRTEATKTYENIYDLFIEGNFTEAIAKKKAADSLYGRNYWTPQLLYIESVYYIKQRDDSTAKLVLKNIISQFNGMPIAAKATTLLDVLNRRKEIEEELRNLVINMPAEDSSHSTVRPINPGKPITQGPIIPKDTSTAKPIIAAPVANPAKPVIDSVSKQPLPPPVAQFSFDAEQPHYVALVLNKVDPIFVNEAKNAFFRYNRDTYYNKQMQAELIMIDSSNILLLMSPFKNAAEAISYIDQTKPKTSTEIIPWLKGGKYNYSIITDKNLEILKNSKDIDKYRQFLEKNLPGKF